MKFQFNENNLNGYGISFSNGRDTAKWVNEVFSQEIGYEDNKGYYHHPHMDLRVKAISWGEDKNILILFRPKFANWSPRNSKGWNLAREQGWDRCCDLVLKQQDKLHWMRFLKLTLKRLGCVETYKDGKLFTYQYKDTIKEETRPWVMPQEEEETMKSYFTGIVVYEDHANNEQSVIKQFTKPVLAADGRKARTKMMMEAAEAIKKAKLDTDNIVVKIVEFG